MYHRELNALDNLEILCQRVSTQISALINFG